MTDKQAAKTKATQLGILVGMFVAVVIMLGVVVYTICNQPQPEIRPVVGHSHTWIPGYKTIHHEAVTEEVVHPAVYVDEVSYHTVCLECDAQVDGFAQQHMADTRHVGCETNVAVTTPVLQTPEYTEVQVVEDAWEEQVFDFVLCSVCGQKLDAPAAETVINEPVLIDANAQE